MAGRLRVEKEGAIGWLVLDNPDRLNAISSEMWRTFPTGMAQFAPAPEVHGAIPRGPGRTRCPGGAGLSGACRMMADGAAGALLLEVDGSRQAEGQHQTRVTVIG